MLTATNIFLRLDHLCGSNGLSGLSKACIRLAADAGASAKSSCKSEANDASSSSECLFSWFRSSSSLDAPMFRLCCVEREAAASILALPCRRAVFSKRLGQISPTKPFLHPTLLLILVDMHLNILQRVLSQSSDRKVLQFHLCRLAPFVRMIVSHERLSKEPRRARSPELFLDNFHGEPEKIASACILKAVTPLWECNPEHCLPAQRRIR